MIISFSMTLFKTFPPHPLRFNCTTFWWVRHTQIFREKEKLWPREYRRAAQAHIANQELKHRCTILFPQHHLCCYQNANAENSQQSHQREQNGQLGSCPLSRADGVRHCAEHDRSITSFHNYLG